MLEPEKIDDLVMTSDVRILDQDLRYEFVEARTENALVGPADRVVFNRNLRVGLIGRHNYRNAPAWKFANCESDIPALAIYLSMFFCIFLLLSDVHF